MKLNSLIIDDDTLSLKVLSQLVESHENLELIGALENAEQGLEEISNRHIDLVFLDIVMPEISGLDFISRLGDNNPYIILTTSHKEYALEAFELEVSDYMVKPLKPERFNKAVEKVLDRYRNEQGLSVNFEEYVLAKLFRFMYSRNQEILNPIPNPDSKIGFSYAMLSAHFHRYEEARILDVLTLANKEKLLNAYFFETIYLCPNCYEGFMQYREVCPKCNSSNLASEDLIHHFPCAYIGPISDFTEEGDPNALVCPKCDQYLKHIGVDYDKPSQIYNCNNCDHRFQDVFVKARCLSCSSDSAVEHLSKRVIQQYELTNKGIEAAKMGSGFLEQSSMEEKIPGTVDMETFHLMLQYEIRRKGVADFESNIAYLHVVQRKQLVKNLDYQQTYRFYEKMVEMIKAHLSNLDIISYKDSSTALFSLNDLAYQDAEKRIKQIIQNLKSELMEWDKTLLPEFTYNVKVIEAGVNYQDQLDDLINVVNSE